MSRHHVCLLYLFIFYLALGPRIFLLFSCKKINHYNSDYGKVLPCRNTSTAADITGIVVRARRLCQILRSQPGSRQGGTHTTYHGGHARLDAFILLGYSFFSNIYEFTPPSLMLQKCDTPCVKCPSDHMGWSRFG
jgi:hypothetical protein